MEHTFSRCENCEWLIEKGELPACLLTGKNTGLLLCCDKFKENTGKHITLF